ncbi:MAG: ice-binding family protein [Bacteroidota bacterium]|nr:ice-binding family protein [Bacteroidota bacterium]
MKSKILLIITAIALLAFPGVNFAQAPTLGTAADFVLFTSNGAITNTGITHVTGHVGTNSGSSTAFGNVDGVMHDNDGASAACAADLLIAYNQLNATVPTNFPGILLGNGQTLNAGVFSIPAAATMNLDLNLDAQGNPGAVFIFLIQGSFSTNAGAKVKLVNGALACNVFWKIEGLVDMAAGTTMRGTVIANNAGINLNAGDTLEGRALSTTGAITISNSRAYIPLGCGSPVLTGPIAPALASVACYTVFSANGPVTNVGVTYITGDVGSNLGLTTGFNPLFVTGTIHPIPDGSTATCATDLGNVYNYLNLLPYDIELLYPAQFGNNLILTPHTYLMNSAVTFTDTLFLDALGNPNAVFIFQINGAVTTSVYSKVALRGGARAENIYWKVEGAVDINDYSIFKGSIICNNGAINLLTGVDMVGRALTTVGAVNTSAITAIAANNGCPSLSPPNIITPPVTQFACVGDSVSFIVNATGAGLTYQWRRGSVNLVDGGNISGATTDTLTINPVGPADAGNNYNVIIYGTYSPNDTSANVSLVINAAPLITSQPANQTACPGDSISFQVSATGAGLTYQWRRGLIPLVNAGNISGVNTPVLTINPVSAIDVATDYNVVVSGTCSPAETSQNASLSLNTIPVIILNPVNQTVCAGDSVSFIVVATGTGLTYQWRKGSVNLINSASVSGVQNDTLTIDPVSVSDGALNYNVIVIGACSGNDTSINVSLTVNTAPVITAGPVNQLACLGDSVSFQVAAAGSNLTYQWRKGSVNLINLGNISGVTTATLTINPVSALDFAANYNVVISGSCAPNDTSANASLSNGAPVIIIQPINQTVCSGNPVSFTVSATGTGLTYQWKKGSVNLVNAGNISGATSATLTINPANISDAALNYNVVVSGTCSPADTSLNVSLTVNPTPVAVAASNTPVCVDSAINLTAQAVNGATYSWTGPNGYTSSNQNPVITPASVTDAGNYTLVVSAAGCISTPSTITVSVDTCIVDDFHIPDGFSPNGDGTNDLFVIRGILNFPSNTFVIYNRWGNKVFEANPYQNTWNGTSTSGLQVGGDQLPVGTYFYVLDLGDGTPVYKGTIYLNR